MARDISVALELDNRQFNRAIKQSENEVKNFSTQSRNRINMVAGAFAAFGGFEIVRNIVKIGQTFQDLQVSLDFVTGSAEAGEAAFDNLTKLATQTQFGVEDLVQTFIRLKGAGIEPTNDLLLTFADTASLAQDELGVLTALTELFARAASKGKLELTDFDKVAERGIDIYGALRKEFQMSITDIQELAKTASGQERLFKGIEKALDDSFGGALQEKLRNSSIAFSNLGIAARRLGNALFVELGLTNTSAIEGLTDAINRLADSGQTLKNIFIGLITILSFIFNPFQKIGLAVAGVSKFFVGLTRNSGPLARAFNQLKKNGDNFLSVLKAQTKELFGFGGGVLATSKTLQGLRTTLSEATSRFLAFASAATAATLAFFGFKKEVEEDDGFVGPPKPPTLDDPEDTTGGIEETKDAVADFLKTLQDKLVNLTNFNAAMKEAEELFGSDKTVKGIDDYKRAINGVESAFEDISGPINEAKEEAEELAEEQRELAKRLEEGRRAIDKFKESFSDQALITEELNEKQAELNALLTKYPELADAIAQAQDVLDEAFSKSEGLNSFLDTLGRAQVTLSESLADAFLEGKDAMDSFKDFFKTLVKQIIADIIRLSIIQPILASILSPFGFGFGAGGGIIRLAGGGRIMANQPAIVGEEGPELFMPSTAGTVIPNGEFGIGGAPSQQVTYNINAVDTQSFQQALARDPEFLFAVTQQGAKSLPRS